MIGGANTVRAYLGLGGNIGDPARAMAASLRALDAANQVRVAESSSLYRTPPWGVSDQPDFLNAVAAIDTDLSARELLELCLETERALKRVRAERWGPRVIDMDILLFGTETIDEEGLQVPHPRMRERAFVLAPLAEIAPGLDLNGSAVEACLSRVGGEGIVRLPGGRDWWRTAVDDR
ncbi:2-amino-4-hydroxy-6-hydroxymethyldihydropteridine diphosphokinase [Mesorhizobium sp. CAU 1741]|uniref:2-amino-4-hydroxy-6- hydroxymethyldihydropteridine diphosphokinase n=1 Tax=Mesorhizobium sp. CAU 1741 TaxID=3140366 RepID=UPI00325A72C5